MKILLLGPSRPDLEAFLASCGDQVERTEAPVDIDSLTRRGPDWLISYGYRHIIRRDVIERYPNRIINLHVSYLPWNRGADPNLWSFVEDTPKGVTIHFIDVGIDTGDIIAQELVEMFPDDTLRTSYDRLTGTIESLFKRVWPDIRSGCLTGKRQPPGGSVHRLKDKTGLESLLTKGWDTPVKELAEARAGRAAARRRGRND